MTHEGVESILIVAFNLHGQFIPALHIATQKVSVGMSSGCDCDYGDSGSSGQHNWGGISTT